MNPAAIILRVPILYGATEYNGESAVNALIDSVKDVCSLAQHIAKLFEMSGPNALPVLTILSMDENRARSPPWTTMPSATPPTVNSRFGVMVCTMVAL